VRAGRPARAGVGRQRAGAAACAPGAGRRGRGHIGMASVVAGCFRRGGASAVLPGRHANAARAALVGAGKRAGTSAALAGGAIAHGSESIPTRGADCVLRGLIGSECSRARRRTCRPTRRFRDRVKGVCSRVPSTWRSASCHPGAASGGFAPKRIRIARLWTASRVCAWRVRFASASKLSK
jgi:hypothetical protein